ncbi:MAG TPA: DoxX family membrane protein [Mycobacteriales bacterium]|nr:DoxX family membrane protein [Mycobacteriales bacterium]
MLVRRLARPMLASVFVFSGANVLRNPVPTLPAAEKVAPPVAEHLPGLSTDTMDLVRINAAVQLGAGALLAAGRLPRLAALALAGSLVPTTLAGHRFWEETDAAARGDQLTQFVKNVSLLGGLLIAAVDTGGRGSARRRAAKAARKGAAKAAAKGAKGTAKAGAATAATKGATKAATKSAAKGAVEARRLGRLARREATFATVAVARARRAAHR